MLPRFAPALHRSLRGIALLVICLSTAALAGLKLEPPGKAFVEIRVAKNRACALTAAGEGECWGYDEQWELGAESRGGKAEVCTKKRAMCSRSPLPIAGGHAFASLAPGEYAGCGATKAGELYCWGNNSLAPFGDGKSRRGAKLPEKIELAFKPVELSAGGGQTCALDAEGRAYCWGANDTGKAGPLTGETCGKTPCTYSPKLVSETMRFSQLSAGGSHTCAVEKSGKAYCWGLAVLGQLGAPLKAEESSVPVEVTGGHEFRSVSAGYIHTCGVTKAGEGLCWGGAGPRLGNGSSAKEPNVSAPGKIKGGLKWKAISAGVAETCGVAEGGKAYCWGLDWAGQLGNGKVSDDLFAEPQPVAGGHKFSAIAVGAASACALDEAGRAFCWGDGRYGQLGAGRDAKLEECGSGPGNPKFPCSSSPTPVIDKKVAAELAAPKEEMD